MRGNGWSTGRTHCYPARCYCQVCGYNTNIDQFCGYWRLSQYPTFVFLPVIRMWKDFMITSSLLKGSVTDFYLWSSPANLRQQFSFNGFGTKTWQTNVWLILNRLVSRLSQIPFIVCEPEAEQFIHSKLNLIAHKGRNACFTKCGPFIIFMYGQKLQQFDILHAINLYISRPPRKGNSNLYWPENL